MKENIFPGKETKIPVHRALRANVEEKLDYNDKQGPGIYSAGLRNHERV